MAFVITRLCQDCVDGACVSVCPKDCILRHTPVEGGEALPNQLFIDPNECIDCRVCEPECPWEAIYPDDSVPRAFADDIALNALSADRARGFDVPIEHLRRRASAEPPGREQIEANKARRGLSRGAA